MEQIVLHATDDAPERRNVESQDAVQVHAAKFVRYPGRRPQNAQEQAMISRILPELLVDQVQIPFDNSDGMRADAAQVLVLLKQKEQLE